MSSKMTDWLQQLLKFRAAERRSRLEFNCYTGAEDEAWCKEDDEIRSEIQRLSTPDECILRELTIDEAIEHARDVASKSDTACAKQHGQLANWLSELKETKDKFLHLAADFDNYKKRVDKEKALATDEAKKKILLSILGIVDDMERLMEDIRHHELLDDLSGTDVGFELIYENFLNILKELNCKPIACDEGSAFDVNFHEAVSVEKLSADHNRDWYAPDTVKDVLQTGWLLNGKLLRPTKVTVWQE